MGQKKEWTKEETAKLVEAYLVEPTFENVKALAIAHERTVASVRSKLAAEGVYQKSEQAAAKASKVTKEDLAGRIATELLGWQAGQTGGLENANKPALQRVLRRWPQDDDGNYIINESEMDSAQRALDEAEEGDEE